MILSNFSGKILVLREPLRLPGVFIFTLGLNHTRAKTTTVTATTTNPKQTTTN